MIRAAEALIVTGDEDAKAIVAQLVPMVGAPGADPLLFHFWLDERDGIMHHVDVKLSNRREKLQREQVQKIWRELKKEDARRVSVAEFDEPELTRTEKLWTAEQEAEARRWVKLDRALDSAAPLLYEKLEAKLGKKLWEALSDYVDSQTALEDDEPETSSSADKPKAGKKKKRGPFNHARRVSRSPETWRILKNYPAYEISSHGRVRSLDRARPDDWLKPRRKWYRGVCVEWVVIRDRDGQRCERMVGKLLIDAGFLPRPEWMN